VRDVDRGPIVYSDRAPLDLVALLRPPAWHADSLCREPAYAAVSWFPQPGEDLTAAKAVCARCLVAQECLAAGAGEYHVIWGGASTQQRQRKAPAGTRVHVTKRQSPNAARRRSAAAGRARRAAAAQRSAA
jgi:hypothetical protein